VLGKGRKRRDTPLDKATIKLLRSWLCERRGEPDDALFPSRRGGRLSPDAVQRLVAKHVKTARATCPSLANKQVSTHTLRHSCAMDLLRNGVDVAVLALWLGHEKLESVNAYIQADPTLKERALDRLTPLNPQAQPGRYRPSDDLLAFLEAI
jgi:integrase